MACDFCFHEIVNKDKWQDIQNHFSDVFKVSLRTVDPKGALLTAPSAWGGVCEQLLQDNISIEQHCRACLDHLLTPGHLNWREGYVCPLGFHNFAIPLIIKDTIIAFLIVGPVIIGKRQEYSFYENTARCLNLKVEPMCDMVKSMKTFTFYGISAVIDFLYDIGLYIFQFGYQNVRLKRNNADILGVLDNVHDLYVERLLLALLEVSLTFTDAERGSIMLFDRNKNELYIKTAKGIDKDIIAKTRVKPADGLCGLAFTQGKALFVNNDTHDEEVRDRLANKKIKNAMIVPISANKQPIGVLNVGTYKENSDKFKRYCSETLNKLITLVETTLSDLPSSALS